ncbi:hypothetical protein FACS189474_4200 [Bacteroidia bacterium]|nr:hypothetical protein FACS189474_4200 [Bacteroidia bacterium]
MNRIESFICMIVCVVFSLSSCIKEDLENCPPETQPLRLVFAYEEAETHAIHPDELQQATLFVFDENDHFVSSWSLDKPVLNTRYEPDLKLLPGNYSFVVWFNLLAPYAVTPSPGELLTGRTVRSQGKFQLEVPGTRIINEQETSLPLLLYGNKADLVKENAENIITIPVVQNTNRINITVNGLAPTDHTYRFEITDDNGNYTFDNDIAPCDPFSYVSDTRYSPASSQLNTSLTVLKLAENRNPVLKIQDQTTVLLNADLVRLIQLIYPKNDFNKKHVYDIDILYIGTDVSVNGWKLNLSDDELFPN